MAGSYTFRTKQGQEIYGYLCDIARRSKRGDVVVVTLGYRAEDTTKFVEHLLSQDAHVALIPSASSNGTACTSYIQRFPSERNLHYKTLDTKRLIVVRTPGIDTLGLSDAEALEEFIEIASPLRRSKPTFRSCIVSIITLQEAGLARRVVGVDNTSEICFPSHPALLSQITGGAPSCALVTSGWGAVSEEIGRSQERNLRRILWGDEDDGALAFRLSEDHPKQTVWACLDALTAKLAVESRNRPTLPTISIVRLTRWLSTIHTEQAKEPGTSVASPFVAPPPHTMQMKRPFRLSIRSRTLSSQCSSRSPSLYLTPPSSPVKDSFTISQPPRPRHASGLRNALHNSRLSGRLSFVEVVTDGGSSWADGDRVSSEGMSGEVRAKQSWVENFNSSGKGSSSWEDCDGDIQVLSLGSGGSVGGGRVVVGEDEEDEEDEEEAGPEEEVAKDTSSEKTDDGPGGGDFDKLKESTEEDEWSEVITEYSGETEWGEGVVDSIAGIRQTSPGPSQPTLRVIGQDTLSSTTPTAAPSTPQTRRGSSSDLRPPDIIPPPRLASTPSSVTIALPVELFRVSHEGSLSSAADFSSVEETEATAASSSNSNGNGGTNYFGGASHFGVNTVNVVTVNVNVTVNA